MFVLLVLLFVLNCCSILMSIINCFINFKIKEGLKTFGVNENSDSLPVIVLVVREVNDCDVKEDIFHKIKGKLLPIESLKSLRDESLIQKV